MATFLFDKILFGPVQSRRLGSSLGINLLPSDEKLCNFNCVYCECGWNPDKQTSKMPTYQQFSEALSLKLQEMQNTGVPLDTITFAGNGEPTAHKDFPEIINETIEKRNVYFPKAKIAVLSNATMLHKNSVVDALLKIDSNIQKIDSAFKETRNIINLPSHAKETEQLLEELGNFHGKVTIQTMFIRGEHLGKTFDNTSPQEIAALIDVYKKLQPESVMIYCISRDTPTQSLEKISKEELDSIAEEIKAEGLKVHVSY